MVLLSTKGKRNYQSYDVKEHLQVKVYQLFSRATQRGLITLMSPLNSTLIFEASRPTSSFQLKGIRSLDGCCVKHGLGEAWDSSIAQKTLGSSSSHPEF